MEDAPEAKREKRERHLTIHVTATLDRRIERRIAKLRHEPSKSSWAALVLRQHLDDLDRREREKPPEA